MRDIVGYASSMLLALVLACTPHEIPPPQVPACPAAPDEVAGRVFADGDGDGVLDPGEVGVSDVSVSDLAVVVRTDADGCFALPNTADWVTVTQPAGWRLAVKPDGRPDHYRSADGSLDFPLTPVDEPPVLELALVADPQMRTRSEVRWAREGLSALDEDPVDYVLVLGNVMSDDLTLLDSWLEAAGTLGAPVLHVVGNHDLDLAAPDDPLRQWTQRVAPPWYSVDLGQAHLVVLDSVQVVSLVDGELDYAGGLGDAQLSWLAEDLAYVPADRLLILAMHIPVASSEPPPRGQVVDSEALYRVIEGRPALLLGGHAHLQEHHWAGVEHGFSEEVPQRVVTALSGSWWSGPRGADGAPVSIQRDGTPRGWHRLRLEGGTWTERWVPSDPASGQLHVVWPRSGTVADARARGVVVNVHGGGPDSRVRVQVDDGAWHVLDRREEVDDSVAALFAGPSWGGLRAVKSTHLWVGELPAAGRTQGAHRLTVEVSDPGWGEAVHTERLPYALW